MDGVSWLRGGDFACERAIARARMVLGHGEADLPLSVESRPVGDTIAALRVPRPCRRGREIGAEVFRLRFREPAGDAHEIVARTRGET